MKLVFLTSRFPYPLEKGDKLRSYHFIKELSHKNEVILISLNESKVDEEHLKHMKSIVSEVHVFHLSKISRYFNTFLALFKNIPLQVGYFYNPFVKKKIKKIINTNNPEHIFCQLLRTTEYVKKLIYPKTLDYQDVFSHGVKRRIIKSKFFLRLALQIEYKKLMAYEEKVFEYFENKIIISETDRDLIPHIDKDKIQVVPNGVDFEYFNPELFQNSPKKYDLLFTGNMGYPPNIDCSLFIAKKVIPLLNLTYPSLTLCIAGANPHSVLTKLNQKNITVTGWVDDIRPFYAASKIFLAPMQIGTGLQNKLLEAMSMGLPCITSNLANSALNAKPNVEILVADNAEEVARHIVTLMEDKEFAAKLAENGKKFVLENFSWKYKVDLIEKIIKS